SKRLEEQSRRIGHLDRRLQDAEHLLVRWRTWSWDLGPLLRAKEWATIRKGFDSLGSDTHSFLTHVETHAAEDKTQGSVLGSGHRGPKPVDEFLHDGGAQFREAENIELDKLEDT